MSKRAEERALELFPVDMQMCIDSTGEPYETDVNAQRRKYVAFGYDQAEKDLALTPGDMNIIDEICTEMRLHTDLPLKGQDAFYEEVLRRFKKRKGEA